MTMETLHIYSQEIWHDEAYIAGTHEALTLLRDAIDAALKTGTGRAECFVCDGEGYRIEVVATDDEKMDKMAVPYTDPNARASAGDNFGPWSLLRPNVELRGGPAVSSPERPA
jgi:hypothetical protein